MTNKPKRMIRFAAALLLLACFMASCANLPTKVVPAATSGPEQPSDPGSGVSGTVDDGQLITNPNTGTWTEPSGGPTVTPIVLSVEKRGQEGVPVIREDPVYEEPVYGESEPVYYDSEVYSTPTPVPANVVMKDEMEVYSFAPVSGSVVLPGQALHMDVMLKNSGTTTWQTSYKVTDVSANPMTVTREYYLPYAVSPGGTVLLSIYMAAPSAVGNYQASFSIQDAYGAVFGTFDYTLVVGSFSSITEIPTLTATVTPTYYSAEGITATPDSLAWMCIDPERSMRQDCYQFCVEYSDREEFSYCFYDGIRYTTPIP